MTVIVFDFPSAKSEPSDLFEATLFHVTMLREERKSVSHHYDLKLTD